MAYPCRHSPCKASQRVSMALHRVPLPYSSRRLAAGVSVPRGTPRLTSSFTSKSLTSIRLSRLSRPVQSRPPPTHHHHHLGRQRGLGVEEKRSRSTWPSHDASALDSHRASRLLHQSGLGGIHAPSHSGYPDTVQTIFGAVLRDWRL